MHWYVAVYKNRAENYLFWFSGSWNIKQFKINEYEKFLQDLFQGKFAISYIVNYNRQYGKLREIKWLNKMPIFGKWFATIQIFWFITKKKISSL